MEANTAHITRIKEELELACQKSEVYRGKSKWQQLHTQRDTLQRNVEAAGEIEDEGLLQVLQDIKRGVQDLCRQVHDANSLVWHEIRTFWQTLRLDVERFYWQRSLLLSSDENEMASGLHWMVELGEDEQDLECLEAARAREVPQNTFLPELLDRARDETRRRYFRPSNVISRERQALSEHRDQWEREYPGQFVAIVGGNVIHAAHEKTDLMTWLTKEQEEMGPFRAYIADLNTPPEA